MHCGRTLLTLAFLLSHAVAGASEAELEAGTSSAELEQVVVRATRLETDAMRLPFAVTRVDRDEVQLARQQLGLDEALAGVPGVFFQNRYNFAQDLRIAIRGFGARADFGIRGIRLYLDGIPLTLPDGQGSVDSIDMGSIESIEVLRGPSSAIYGAASGGAIVMESETGSEDPYYSARLNAGSYGFAEAQFNTGGQTPSLDYMANLSATRLGGYRSHSKTRRYLLNARLGHDWSETTRINVVVNAVDSPESEDPGGLTAAEVETDRRMAAPRNLAFDAGESLAQVSLGASLETQLANGDPLIFHGHMVERNFDNRLPFDINANGQGGSVELDRRFYGLGVRWTTPVGETTRLMLGGEYQAQRDRRNRFANQQGERGLLTTAQDEDVTNSAAFAQLDWPLGDEININLGARLDQVRYQVNDLLGLGGSGETTYRQLSPLAGVSYQAWPGASLYANISQSFDPPATTELANPLGPTGLNQALRPQTATNYEAGVKAIIGRLGFEIAVFHIDVDDALVPYELEGSGQTFYENAGASSHDGLETALRFEWSDGLSGSLSYTYSNFRFDSFVSPAGEVFDGNDIPGIPRHLVQGSLSWRSGTGWFAAADVLHASSFFADNANQVKAGNYAVANLRAEYRRSGQRFEVAPFVGINNLFDEQYSGNIRLNAAFGRYYEPAPGRNVYAGITFRVP